MQETASFVSGLVRRRPQLSFSAPPNKSFICILKVIHNLKQKERKKEKEILRLNNKADILIYVYFNC